MAVHYKTEPEVLSFLRSLMVLASFDEVLAIIIDNASGETHLSKLRSSISPVSNLRLFELPVNLGYLGAAKYALERYQAEGDELPEWIIVSNSDILIEDREFLERLFAHDASSIGMIAPKIIVPSSKVNQNPFMRRRPGWTRRFRV